MIFCNKKFGALVALFVACIMLMPVISFAVTYETIEYGDRGSEVLELQKGLIELGYAVGNADGKFGNSTERAVKLFQEDHRLTADGKAGNKTRQIFYEEIGKSNGSSSNTTDDETKVTVTNPNTLKYGDRGTAVKKLQDALLKIGYNPGVPDGSFGANTKLAVIAFQRNNKLTADGLAGEVTLKVLYRLSDSNGFTQPNNGNNEENGNSDGSFSRTLRRGAVGADVVAVQKQLSKLGYYSLSVDGEYGLGCIAATEKFQSKNGLYADGLVGRLTYSKLFSNSAVSNNSSNNNSSNNNSSTNESNSLRLGDTGNEVRKMQQELRDLDYNVTTDGSFGTATENAVIEFQKRNKLTADGVAGKKTLDLLFSGKAKPAQSTSSGGYGTVSGPSGSSVKLLHWFDQIKPTVRSGQTLVVFDPSSRLQWNLRLYSPGRHADCEPITAKDTEIMYKAFGNTNTWEPKSVYVKLPNGSWSLASMHNMPHLSGNIRDNNFDGHLCVHFLRDMEETMKNDPSYGVKNQNLIRKTWKNMTGETVTD